MAITFSTAATKRISVNGSSFVYRTFGEKQGIPVVFLHHLTGCLDDWDPALIDGIAEKHPVITFDNRGVGASEGKAPDNVEDMAKDAVDFIRALGVTKVDLFGFSLGGFLAQVIAQNHPDLVRKIIIAGASAAGGEGISEMASVFQNALAETTAQKRHIKEALFFVQSDDGQNSAKEFLARLSVRQQDRDTPVSYETIVAQLTAITKWGMQPAPASLNDIRQPVLVVNGDSDIMAPAINSVELARKLPHSELSIFPAAGHGAIFQYHSAFVDQALRFLAS